MCNDVAQITRKKMCKGLNRKRRKCGKRRNQIGTGIGAAVAQAVQFSIEQGLKHRGHWKGWGRDPSKPLVTVKKRPKKRITYVWRSPMLSSVR